VANNKASLTALLIRVAHEGGRGTKDAGLYTYGLGAAFFDPGGHFN